MTRAFASTRLALSLLVNVVACSPDASVPVDPGVVGTWELMVPNAAGVARWVWDVHADGTYAFHAEGPGDVPTHSGTFEAREGKYSLRSTTIVWVDSGTYQLAQPNTMRATGVLGTASWSRVRQSNTRSAAILAFLGSQPLDPALLVAPFGNPRTEIAGFDTQAQNDGVIGVVRTAVQSPDGPGTIAVRVYRDWTTAQAAYAADALILSPTFRIRRGQYANSQTYTLGKVEARCLARTTADVPTRTVTCYRLVNDPTQEPVVIVGEFSEARADTNLDASEGAYEHSAALLTAGIRYVDLNFIPMKAKGLPQ